MVIQIIQIVYDEIGLSFYSGLINILASDYPRATFAALYRLKRKHWIRHVVYCLLQMSVLFMKFHFLMLAFGSASTDVYNFHVLAYPPFDLHAFLSVFDASAKFFDALFADWRNFSADVRSCGNRLITLEIQNVLATLANSLLKLFRIWCRPLRYDVLMQRAYSKILGKKFCSTWPVYSNVFVANKIWSQGCANMPISWWYSLDMIAWC